MVACLLPTVSFTPNNFASSSSADGPEKFSPLLMDLRVTLPVVPLKRLLNSQFSPLASKAIRIFGGPICIRDCRASTGAPLADAFKNKARCSASTRVLLPDSFGPLIRVSCGEKVSFRSPCWRTFSSWQLISRMLIQWVVVKRNNSQSAARLMAACSDSGSSSCCRYCCSLFATLAIRGSSTRPVSCSSSSASGAC